MENHIANRTRSSPVLGGYGTKECSHTSDINFVCITGPNNNCQQIATGFTKHYVQSRIKFVAPDECDIVVKPRDFDLVIIINPVDVTRLSPRWCIVNYILGVDYGMCFRYGDYMVDHDLELHDNVLDSFKLKHMRALFEQDFSTWSKYDRQLYLDHREKDTNQFIMNHRKQIAFFGH